MSRSGKLFLHPINETHQFRPTLTYMDTLTRKSKRRGGGYSDDESDGPPPDPDEAPPEKLAPKKEKKASSSNAKEVTVAVRRGGESAEDLGGLSSLRRELIGKRKKEREEPWQSLNWNDEGVRSLQINHLSHDYGS